jgi:CubicO group peptidase (beta-lactamase class C family)
MRAALCVVGLLACDQAAAMTADVRSSLPVTATLAPRPPPPPRPDTTATRYEAGVAGDWLPRAAPEDVGLDVRAIERLVADAITAESDSLVVIKDGKLIVERYFGRARGPIETRSVTKSVAGLAVLALIADGKIPSLDVPIARFFPELEEGDKAKITLRHVLTHRSGLAHGDDADALNAAADRLAYARGLPLASPPGARFSYNNEAAQLLAGVIASASGKPADVYVRERLFAPLGIGKHTWAHDRSGGAQTYYGLALHARDLARLGLMLLDEGGEVLPAKLVRAATAMQGKSPPFGLMFWLRCRLTQREPPPFEALTPLGKRRFASEDAWLAAADALLPARERALLRIQHRRRSLLAPEPSVGFFAVGGQGQRLVVYPSARLVAVRQHRRRPGDDAKDARITWRAFHDRVEDLDPALAP